MKKILKLFICLSLFACLFLVGLPRVEAAYNSKYETETAPATYYSGLNMNQTGENFRRDLSAIISSNFNHHSYKTNNTVLVETDPDPKHNGNVICFYTGQSLSGGWNKEHVWAKSHGFPNTSDYPYCDAHHLRPTLNSINSSRGNSDFGEVDGESGVKSDGYGNKWTSTIFEPRDEVKGDVARIMFYMATRYGFDGKFNLKLVDDKNTSRSTGNGRFGGLQTLLKWHYQDPVSKSEIYRNNVIYDDWQHNRNPYIDHPEYVDLAWPNSYSKQEIDQTKVDAVIAQIGALPEVITLAEKELVVAAKTAYDALNYAEKQLVVNESVLTAAVETIQALETPEDPIEPSKPNPVETGSVTVDFANHGLSNIGYTTDYNFKIGDKEFYTSNVGIFAGELRIGSNNKESSPITQIDAKYGLDVTGVVLEQKFDVKNSKTLNISISSNYGAMTSWYVLFQKAGSTNYTVVASKSESEPKSITASLLAPETGHFVVVFVGSDVRRVLSSYQIVTATDGGSTEELPVYSNYKTYTSAKGTMTNGVLSDAGLRFGGLFEKSLFANATGFGVIVVDANDLGDGSIEEFNEFGTAKELVDFFVECGCHAVYQDFKDTKTVVNENGTEYYQFGYELSDVLGNEKKSVHAVVYVEINNEVHFLQEVVTSYYDTLLEYLTSGVLSKEELTLVSTILENL